MNANEAYKQWKMANKVDLSVKTDYQMFELGYNYRNDEIKELTDLVLQLDKQLKESKNEQKTNSKSTSNKDEGRNSRTRTKQKLES